MDTTIEKNIGEVKDIDTKYNVTNWINGCYSVSEGSDKIAIKNPKTDEVISSLTFSTTNELDIAVNSAKKAQEKWSQLTHKSRVQVIFKYRSLLENNFRELSALCAEENGKTIPEAEAEISKAIELCELAISIPQTINDRRQVISRGIECKEQKYPVGVVASIVPLNFPVMVPHWTIPMVLVLGNALILKPSEQVPLSCLKIAELMQRAGLPDGLLSIINGGKEIVESICDHSDIDAITFVGSSAVAKLVYERSARSGKRCIALGGAKNNLLLLPDADPEMASTDIVASFTGCAGQRCMAASLLIAVGDVDHIINKVIEKSRLIQAGENLGALITNDAKLRIVNYINQAEISSCNIVLDGRNIIVNGGEKGYFLNPTIIDNATLDQPWSRDEIFGPVLTIIRVNSIDEAIELQNTSIYGNGASVYTQDGEAADYVINRLTAGMCGINIGVPVPREPFGFGGWKASKYGVSDITGQQSIDFFTKTKKITTKWNSKYKKDWMS